MANKEARCTNCGSINIVDTAAPTFKCLFCRAVVDTQEGLDIALDADDYEFPNEPQPETDDEVNPASLYNQALKQNQPVRAKKTSGAKKKPQASGTRKTDGPKARVEKIEMPSATISTPAKIKIAAVLVGILLITAAAVLPVTMIRDAHRSDLVAKLDSVLPFDYNGDRAYSISTVSNKWFSVVSEEDVDAETVLQVYKNYCEARAEVYGWDLAADSFQKIYGSVRVQVLSPSGGYEVSGLKTPEALNDLTQVASMD